MVDDKGPNVLRDVVHSLTVGEAFSRGPISLPSVPVLSLQKVAKSNLSYDLTEECQEVICSNNSPVSSEMTKLRTLNCGKLVGLWRRPVVRTMMPGIPKFRKESHPERGRNKRRPIHSYLPRDSGAQSKFLSFFHFEKLLFSFGTPAISPDSS